MIGTTSQQMRRGVQPLLFAAVLALALTASPPAGEAASAKPVRAIYVSPSGDDHAAGTPTDPLRTLQKARDRARRLLARGDNRSVGVTVILQDGTYRLARPLRLDWRDSGSGKGAVSYQAAPGARPVLTGARKVSGFKLVDGTLGIYKASVPVGTQSRQLYVNGRRAIRARSTANPDGFWRTEAGYQAPDSSMASWRRPSDLELVTLTQWKMMRCPVASIAGNQIVMAQPCWSNANVFPYLWSFQLITRLENAYELLDQPGEWYLDSTAGALYYIPRIGEQISSSEFELPVAQRLIDGVGTAAKPVQNIRFSGITFEHATWMDPSGPNGYAADQSGFHLVGAGHPQNAVGHDPDAVRTPGNVSFKFARGISFQRNSFRGLGAVALDFGSGSQGNKIVGNRFDDISSAAVQVGGIAPADHHPLAPAQLTKDNTISNNLIRRTGREFADSAAIFAGYTTRSKISHNEISDVPWSGIALGWGWGLVDPGSYLGLPGATPGMWGSYATPTASLDNRIEYNRIHNFLTDLWDGGGIYTVGQQGTTQANGTMIRGNVISGKRRLAGGNTIYTDGGSRFVNVTGNILFNNAPGITDFGPCGLTDSLIFCWLMSSYGTDRGGCRTYGDIVYTRNYWQHPDPFFSICPYPPHPVNVVDQSNQVVSGAQAVSKTLLGNAGRQGRYLRSVGAGATP